MSDQEELLGGSGFLPVDHGRAPAQNRPKETEHHERLVAPRLIRSGLLKMGCHLTAAHRRHASDTSIPRDDPMTATFGISNRAIAETPIAILDFETTGLVAGADRVVEVSVVRLEPGKEPRLVLDTLVNPMRRMGATEIHGITDQDVVNAPRFCDIAGEVVGALSGCAVAAYNVYFDMKFLGYELQNSGVAQEPPHLCLMYLRPMLGLGSRCKLEEACRFHGIEYQDSHVAGNDAMASAKLFRCYLDAAQDRGVRTFADLARLKKYKFSDSFANEPFPHPSVLRLSPYERLCSRIGYVHEAVVDPMRRAFVAYWDAIKTVVADLDVSDDEVAYVLNERTRYGLTLDQIRSVHAKAFASVIAQFAEDRSVDDREVRKLQRLHRCLSRLGWAPGE